jgi:transcriptional regulator with XRE-family HTH domain
MAELDQDQQFQTMPVGERLRQAREAKSLSLDDVAAQTRIPTRHLQHIERGEWDALPAVTYSVGFARSYANAVGLNGTEIGAELREQLGSGRPPGAAAEYYQPADPSRVPPRSLALITAVIGVLLVVGYLIWRSGVEDAEAPTVQGQGAQIALPEPQPVQQAPAPAAASGPVVLTAAEPVWMRVSDGGASLFEGTLAAGQSFTVPATAQAPMLRVGAPQALRIAVGQTQIPQVGPSGRPIGNVSLLPAELAARAQGGAAGGSPAGAAPAPTGASAQQR